MKVLIIYILFCFSSISLVAANDFSEGRDINSVQAIRSLEAYAKYKMGQYEEAREIWSSLAEQNNATAMINLANLYEQGQGVERDLKQSIDWLTKAADLGDTRGQFQLAMAYEKGLGVERDLQKAAYWLTKAAEQGDETAQFNLGVMLATNYGKGLATSSEEQRTEAMYWLTNADNSGFEDAREFLNLLSALHSSK